MYGEWHELEDRGKLADAVGLGFEQLLLLHTVLMAGELMRIIIMRAVSKAQRVGIEFDETVFTVLVGVLRKVLCR